ncbi:MAG: alpha/beta hydrolase fold protein [Hyphomicrobiales bacterium]|nr:alpha/beta hydrolase fold protein [Hyphomicrobiales bacterium]
MFFKLSSGLRLHYTTRGAGRSVVLLHPVGLDGSFWDGVVGALEADCRLICIDARGHGQSDVPAEPFTLDDLAGDVIELVRAVGQPPAVAVGCSMGGMVAQALGVTAPELFAGVVIANTAHLRNDQGRATMEMRAKEAEKGMPRVLATTLSRWFDPATQLARPELVVKARDWLLAADPVMHASAWRAIRDLNYAERLKHLRMPALAIAGTRDQSTPVAAMKAMAQAIPGCAYEEIDTGHLAPLEQPARFADLLRAFLARLP